MTKKKKTKKHTEESRNSSKLLLGIGHLKIFLSHRSTKSYTLTNAFNNNRAENYGTICRKHTEAPHIKHQRK